MLEGDKFLIADVGGTKALLFLVKYSGGCPLELRKKRFLCADYNSLEEIIVDFLGDEKGVSCAVIGAAGAAENGRCFLTNLSWCLDEKEIEKTLQIKKVLIVNDVELLGRGISSLSKDDLIILQKGGDVKSEVKSIISVGTGLGEGIIAGRKVLPTEGGHCDLAVWTEEEISFLKWMKERHGHVSYERVLSGEGIQNVYEYFTGKRDLLPQEIFREMEDNKTASFFLKVLGKETANLVLKSLSLGGVYLTGGVLEKNFLLLQREDFINAFLSKGRFSSLLKKVQVALIKGDKSVLFGGMEVLITMQ
jgi:glucokinase